MQNKVLVLFTCFNRKEKTMNCINSLRADKTIDFEFIVVDDNSTDGTTEWLQRQKNIEVYVGNGNLFYSGGMRIAIDLAKKRNLKQYDYIMIVNDDVLFFDKSISRLIRYIDSSNEVGVGAMCDEKGQLSYGGSIKTHRFKPSYRNVMSKKNQKIFCDTFCANCVLIPSHIFKKCENIDPVYCHAMGDFDYGFTIKKHGYNIVASNFFVGQCNDNPITGSWKDKSLSRRERLEKKESPKGLPRKEWYHYLKKNHGVFSAIVYSLTPYLRIILGK